MFDPTCCGSSTAHEEKNPFQAFSKWTADLLEKVPSHPFPVDVEELPELYLLTAELPGLEKQQLKVQVEEELLSIFIQPDPESSEQRHFVRKERNHSKLHRTFDITGVDTNRITAHYKNGLLSVILPKLTPSNASVRTVEIQTSSDKPAGENSHPQDAKKHHA